MSINSTLSIKMAFLVSSLSICGCSDNGGSTSGGGEDSQAGRIEYGAPGQFAYVVPRGVNSIQVELWGAKGGQGSGEGGVDGGPGGYATGTLSVTSGEKLYVFVGGRGEHARCDSATQGGFNGGGPGGDGEFGSCFGGAGGGATDIRQSGNDMTNRVVVAGGGGGSGWAGFNGAGVGGKGGGNATKGTEGFFPCQGAGEGSPARGVGGPGFNSVGNARVSGGGGGGYRGGNGACEEAAGGDGGTGLAGPGGITRDGVGGGHGRVIITWTVPTNTAKT